ncbi:CUB and peptidase domain-containing protein 2-like [Orbicella faveolata]|uniref:CUB and peptidase domain-containing protein 2-like n=1 Tax=Orbicella faveolata TaxID=48498 RepID=UPI0009E2742B|nr:CUB and peptidase domain-containing protein 2-like [Orbicella faveolata]
MKLIVVFAIFVAEINALCYDKFPNCKDYVNRPGNLCETNSFIKYKCEKSCGSCGGPRPPVTQKPPEPPKPSRPPVPPPPPGSCGVKPQTRIVGGTKARPGDWPWQAMLRSPRGSSFCGGTLIADQWVLTASHCVYRKRPQDLRVRMGAHKKRGNDPTAQDFEIEKIIMHYSYKKPYGLSHDIALLKLSSPAQLNSAVGIACLPDTSVDLPIDDESKKCWITGWGRLSSGGSSPSELMQAEVPLVSNERCSKSYGRIHASMLCAGHDEGGVDACQGDSGGPLVCKYGGKWHVEGATSWGKGCARPQYFGVYAKVRYMLDWVHEKMASN